MHKDDEVGGLEGVAEEDLIGLAKCIPECGLPLELRLVHYGCGNGVLAFLLVKAC